MERRSRRWSLTIARFVNPWARCALGRFSERARCRRALRAGKEIKTVKEDQTFRSLPSFYLFREFSFPVSVRDRGVPFGVRHSGCAMAKPIAVCALCIVSAAIGAGIDHYFGSSLEQGVVGLIRGPHLQQVVSPRAAVAAPAPIQSDAEVLGDRVKCDVRYQELKIPPDEYQSFKRKCMGDKYSDND